jgi:hypothetical protein
MNKRQKKKLIKKHINKINNEIKQLMYEIHLNQIIMGQTILKIEEPNGDTKGSIRVLTPYDMCDLSFSSEEKPIDFEQLFKEKWIDILA